MFIALSFAFTFAPSAAESKPAAIENRYAAYWLFEKKEASGYSRLLVTRVPLNRLSELTAMNELLAVTRPGQDPTPLLDCAALTISTYQKDSIWNEDRRPLKPLKSLKGLNQKDRIVEVDGVLYRLEDGAVEEAVRLLKEPDGKIPLHRLHGPLSGMEQTARALRLLLEEQLHHEPAK